MDNLSICFGTVGWKLCSINAIIGNIKYIPKYLNIAEDHKGKPKEQTRRISTETVRKKSPLKKEVEKKKNNQTWGKYESSSKMMNWVRIVKL